MDYSSTVSDRGENSFRGEWSKRASGRARMHATDGFFFLGKLPRIAKTTNKNEFLTKQAKFYVEKYNEFRRISIVINACVYSPGMSVELSKMDSFYDMTFDAANATLRIYRIKSSEKLSL